ncbi:16S rRNA (cytosine(967)-C(5))-methyltransferase RsmB [Liquorilactobacillus oeni]|uniref:16S rRNA (cytosine(967)-C(5))-methyltransferase n=1 Tax=Liquorilactobacillus oeni DSM 19972 TaxID=1423777 RepID=A0A0R1M977_9LACO|nr:16S rRNA (cytosine(967)-C(5))-methyltransferase RsmB [Liquorilactobacillus oeni]KRL04703.1 16S rRNA m(5)C 967 methyltransferase [Liquorilactobacillus oeni DSM 19972]
MNNKEKEPTARFLAVDILTRIESNNSYSNLLLNQTMHKQHLSRVDGNLLTKMVYGVLQHRLTLEYWLEPFIKPKKIETWVKQLLLISLYQLQYLDKIPRHAVLNEAIEIAKKRGHDGIRKFVTGVLHAVIRQGLRNLQDIKQPLKRLSITYSVPEWIIESLQRQVGEEKTIKILASLMKVPHQAVRVNTSHIPVADAIAQLQQEGFEIKKSPIFPASLILNNGHALNSTLFREGKIMLQDESAALVVDSMQPFEDKIILDACAAPGGKTMQIADSLKSGKVIALDIHQHKVKLIRENARKCGFSAQVTAQTMDARNASEHFAPDSFEQVLVDAPCSGIGLMRRKPEIRYEKTSADSNNLQRIQLGILEAVSVLVAPKGKLTYSTCTILNTENEKVINMFLKKHPEFEQLKTTTSYHLKDDKKLGLTIYPDEYDSDGFFIATLCKKNVGDEADDFCV